AGDDLRAALAGRAASAKSCYNTALRRNATLEGKMSVNVRVSPRGAVCSAGVSNNTLGDAAVAACVSAQFRSSQFPAPAGGCVDTVVPLNFTAPK
ncbi:MAG TPA: AgmX/PglI C-terminal domain-containing protein, partial [Polyangiaceae bacterium]|nr:AgmX/PglI C-terminal domain-containing protein [Polyangiaceae bacterium]